jgi:seryl-tRNA synthetase
MSKALLQQQAAKAIREREDYLQKQRIDEEHVRSVQQQAQHVQQQVLQVQHAQQALQAQQAQLDLSAQTITRVNRDNAALRTEVDRLIIELNDYDAASALEKSVAEVARIISPFLPAYADISPLHGFDDYEDISITGEIKE